MALLSLQNAVVLVGPANLSGYSNSVEISVEAEEKDVTTFGSGGFRSMLAGMRETTISTQGFWEAGGAGFPDDRMFADLGTTGGVTTVSPTGAAVGDVSYFTRVMRGSYSFGDEVGEVIPFSSEAMGDGTALVRGQIADNQARTATGTTAVRTLTAPTATTRVYAAIHVLAVAGTSPSLTVALQGDDAVGFPSASTVATSAAITAVGGYWLQGPLGATADSFYRLSYTITGTSPSFLLIASIGVG